MFDSNGDKIEPCGVPSSLALTNPSSIMPPLQHPNNYTDDSRVSYSVLQKFYHPAVVNIVKESFDVCFHYVAHILLLDGSSQFIQTQMLASTGSISIAVVLKYLLVNLFQNPL